jgi:hypothetical protein
MWQIQEGSEMRNPIDKWFWRIAAIIIIPLCLIITYFACQDESSIRVYMNRPITEMKVGELLFWIGMIVLVLSPSKH